jgi:type IV secretory pathway TrbL component
VQTSNVELVTEVTDANFRMEEKLLERSVLTSKEELDFVNIVNLHMKVVHLWVHLCHL